MDSDRDRVDVPVGVGETFRVLMQVRVLITAITLLLIPAEEMSFSTVLLVLAAVALSWLAMTFWTPIVRALFEHPLLVAIDVCISFVILSLGGITGPYLLATVTTAVTAGLLFELRGMLAVSFFQMVCYYLTMGSDGLAQATFQSALGQPLFYPLFGFAGVALRRLLLQQERIVAAQRQAEIAAAAADERSRLAREMHDSLAKTLRGIALASAALPLWVAKDRDRAVVEAERIAAATEIASREAHDLLTELREDTFTRSMPEAMREITARWGEQHGVEVACVTDEDVELPLLSRYEAMAVLSESLTNVARHAGAQRVEVSLRAEADAIVLTVKDDGSGFEASELSALARNGHYGLVGLHERTRRAGGRVEVVGVPGTGTTVIARFPSLAPERPLAEVH
ncbi:MAG: ATP-binding protein [Streptosporangiaceae bacterium]